MKHIRHISLCLFLSLVLAINVFAAEVPESFVCENLNGQQRIVKTYVLSPDFNPDTLVEQPFNYDGYHYVWSYTTKEEHPYNLTKSVTETVTVETAKKDLDVVLGQLTPTMSYDDGEYKGELTLDHTTLHTEAAGYNTKRSTTTETKVYAHLASNDMSYVPATITKNGKTLNLANVDWQVTGTAMVGEELVPAEYQAVATYSASSSYQVATGYVTTAEYKGEVTTSGIKDITYEVVYTGSEILPVITVGQGTESDTESDPTGELESGNETESVPTREVSPDSIRARDIVLWVLLLLIAALLAGILVFLYLRRGNVYVYVPGNGPRDYKLVAKFRVQPEEPVVDISELDPYPDDVVAIEVKHSLAKKLVGKEFFVQCRERVHRYMIERDRPGDWHEFNIQDEAGEKNEEVDDP